MIERIRKSSLGLAGTSIFILFLILFLYTPFNGIQFIAMASVPLLFILATFLGKYSFEFRIYDLWGIVLIGFALSSTLWVTNVSFVWNPLAIWLSLFGFMISLRGLLQDENMISVITYILIAAFGVALIQQMLAIHYQIALNESWNKFLFNNRNYTTVFLLASYPFLLFAELKGRFVRFLKFICGAMIVNILLITGAHAASVAFIFLILYFLYTRMKVARSFNSEVLTGLLVFLLAFIVIVTTYQSDISAIISPIYGSEQYTRVDLVNQSIELFRTHPLRGSGWGNWMIDSYEYDILKNDSVGRLSSHNLFIEKICELGILGGLLFVILILYPIGFAINSDKDLRWQQKAACGTMIVYVVSSMYYADVNSYNQHFSGIQLMAFISIALITHQMRIGIKYQSVMKLMLILGSIFAIIWFTYMRHQHRVGSELFHLDEVTEDVNVKLKKTYHPIWNTHFNGTVSYAKILGRNYKALGDLDQARTYLEQAKIEDPHNHGIQVELDSIKD